MENAKDTGTMRKITRQIKEAFERGDAVRIGNTFTARGCVWLHGNKIIETRKDGIYWTLADWPTPTTRERINGILGVGVYQHKHRQYVDGKLVFSDAWYKV